MLEPDTRCSYLAELCPPVGYTLDRALGTTFTLDLLALLMAPLAMALAEVRDQEALRHDPIAVLEAIRRTAGRFAIFCDRGHIAVPRADTRLFSYLEPAVVEVQAPGGGLFHPKIWLLRYTAPGEPVLYRFLCLSRNLTFDRSWDTVLCLEGELQERRRVLPGNQPLADFIRSLPQLAVRPEAVAGAVRQHAEQLAEEVLRVRWELPDGAEEFTFVPLGIRGYRQAPQLPDYRRLLIVSPFLDAAGAATLARAGRGNVLISRPETLDALPPATLAAVVARGEVFTLAEAAMETGDTETEAAAAEAPAADLLTGDLSGLHAKLYIAESGGEARVLTGSANATGAAWGGANVEFLVQLTGRRGRIGIDAFLGQPGDRHAFRQMLLSYTRPESVAPANSVQQRLEQALDTARAALAGAGLRVRAAGDGPGTYSLTLQPEGRPATEPGAVQGRCYPISLRPSDALDAQPLFRGQALRFDHVSAAAVTGFFAFVLTASLDGQRRSAAFVLNLPVAGMPQERDQAILRSVIADRSRFLRYLLFLLAEDSETLPLAWVQGQEQSAAGSEGTGAGGPDLPLLEELVRAFSRRPEKIDRIARVVADLQQTPEGRLLLPEGFDALWAAFTAARSRGVGA